MPPSSQTLESVRQFAEVVVYDNGSTDATLDLASRYPNVKLHRGDFFGFGPTKNHALGLANNEGVFLGIATRPCRRNWSRSCPALI